MARMTLKAVHGDRERRRLPLSDRIVDEHLRSSYRHVPQPPEQPRSPTAENDDLRWPHCDGGNSSQRRNRWTLGS